MSAKLSDMIEGYYQRRFGRVEPDPDRARRQRRWSWIGTFLVFIAIILDEALGPSVGLFLFTTYLVISYVTELIYMWLNRRYAIHHIVALMLLAGLSLLPLFGITEWAIFLVSIGLIILGLGIIDHLLLVRTLKAVPEENDGAGI